MTAAIAPAVWMVHVINSQNDVDVTIDGTSYLGVNENNLTMNWWNNRLPVNVSTYATATAVGATKEMVIAFALAADVSISISPAASGTPATAAGAVELQAYGGDQRNEFQFVHQIVSTRSFTFDGETTSGITDIADLEAALEALSNIGSGNAAVHLHPGHSTAMNVPGVVEFQGSLANTDVALLTWDGSSAGDPELIADGGTPELALLPQPGTLTLSGDNVTFRPDPVLAPQAGSLTLSGANVSLTPEQLLAIQAGTLSLSGANVSLTPEQLLAPQAGTLTLSGANIEFPLQLVPQAGSLSLSGENIDFAADLRWLVEKTRTRYRRFAPIAGTTPAAGKFVST